MPDTTGMKKDSGDLDEEFDIDFKKQCSVMWTSQHFYPAYISTHAVLRTCVCYNWKWCSSWKNSFHMPVNNMSIIICFSLRVAAPMLPNLIIDGPNKRLIAIPMGTKIQVSLKSFAAVCIMPSFNILRKYSSGVKMSSNYLKSYISSFCQFIWFINIYINVSYWYGGVFFSDILC